MTWRFPMSCRQWLLLFALVIIAAVACFSENRPHVFALAQSSSGKAQGKKKTGLKRPLAASDDEPVDPRDDIIKYKGLLSCRCCELMVNKLALLHHTTPMPITMDGQHDRRSKDKKLMAQLETRNAEITEALCPRLIKEASSSSSSSSKSESGAESDLQLLQLHCDRIMGASETAFGKYLTTLAMNTSRLYIPVGEDKNEKTGRITPKFAFDEEVDGICERFCVEKNSMKDQMAKMQEEIKRKQREIVENMSILEIFSEALSLLLTYWYLSVPTVIILTAIGLFIQIKYMLPRDDKGRPILGKDGFAKAYVAPSGKRLGTLAESKKED